MTQLLAVCRRLAAEIWRAERAQGPLELHGLNTEGAVRDRLLTIKKDLDKADLPDRVALHLSAIQFGEDDPLSILEKTEVLVAEQFAGRLSEVENADLSSIDRLILRLLVTQSIGGRLGRWAVRPDEIPDGRAARGLYRNLGEPSFQQYNALLKSADELLAQKRHREAARCLFDADRLVRTPAGLIKAALCLSRTGDFVSALWAVRACLLELKEAFENEDALLQAHSLELKLRGIVRRRSRNLTTQEAALLDNEETEVPPEKPARPRDSMDVSVLPAPFAKIIVGQRSTPAALPCNPPTKSEVAPTAQLGLQDPNNGPTKQLPSEEIEVDGASDWLARSALDVARTVEVHTPEPELAQEPVEKQREGVKRVLEVIPVVEAELLSLEEEPMPLPDDIPLSKEILPAPPPPPPMSLPYVPVPKADEELFSTAPADSLPTSEQRAMELGEVSSPNVLPGDQEADWEEGAKADWQERYVQSQLLIESNPRPDSEKHAVELMCALQVEEEVAKSAAPESNSGLETVDEDLPSFGDESPSMTWAKNLHLFFPPEDECLTELEEAQPIDVFDEVTYMGSRRRMLQLVSETFDIEFAPVPAPKSDPFAQRLEPEKQAELVEDLKLTEEPTLIPQKSQETEGGVVRERPEVELAPTIRFDYTKQPALVALAGEAGSEETVEPEAVTEQPELVIEKEVCELIRADELDSMPAQT